MQKNENKQKGKIGEDLAAEIYCKKGFKILAKNFFNKKGKIFGEIDFVAAKEKHLHFVEIKTRTSDFFGSGAEAFTPQKRMKMVKAAKYFLVGFRLSEKNIQIHFDLVEIYLDRFDKRPGKIRMYLDVIDDIPS